MKQEDPGIIYFDWLVRRYREWLKGKDLTDIEKKRVKEYVERKKRLSDINDDGLIEEVEKLWEEMR